MKKLLFLLVLFLVSNALLAQRREFADRVYLRNGSRLVGKVVSYMPSDSVVLELPSGIVVAYPDRIVSKVVMDGTTKIKAKAPYEFQERGFYNAFSVGSTFGKTGDYGAAIGFGASNVTGYQFNRWLGTGLGLGFDTYTANHSDSKVVSIFGEVRSYLRRRNVSEYVSLVGGFGVPLKNAGEEYTNFRGGFMLQPTFGWRFGAAKHYNFFFDIGARFQRIHFDWNTAWAENSYKITYQRWILRGGLLF